MHRISYRLNATGTQMWTQASAVVISSGDGTAQLTPVVVAVGVAVTDPYGKATHVAVEVETATLLPGHWT